MAGLGLLCFHHHWCMAPRVRMRNLEHVGTFSTAWNQPLNPTMARWYLLNLSWPIHLYSREVDAHCPQCCFGSV
jgi:hypothetical protein